MSRHAAIATVIGTFLASHATAGAVFDSYHIGNSLTWDGRPNLQADFAALIGIDASSGYHINCNQSLLNIVNNPEQICLNLGVPATWIPAVENNAWDAITLQPFWAGNDPPTLAQDLASITTIVGTTRSNPDNAATIFYQYAGWPFRNSFIDNWDNPDTFEPSSPSKPSRQYHDQLFDDVTSTLGVDWRLIPVGEALYVLKDRIENGQIPGVSSFEDEVYRDNIHMSDGDDGIGRHFVASVMFAVMHNANPRYLPDTRGFRGPDSPVPPDVQTETLRALYTVVWDVVSADARTAVTDPCPADINASGEINAADLITVVSNFGAADAFASQGDVNRDAAVNAADLLETLRAFGRDCQSI